VKGRALCASFCNKNLQGFEKSGNMVPTSRNKEKEYKREWVSMDPEKTAENGRR
jgi:hypothetical protein